MDASISPLELLKLRGDTDPPLLIDVRREQAFRAATDMAEGALRRDPDAIEDWIPELPQNARIAVYCVHGHEVSRNAAQTLRKHGFTARFVDGGIEEGLRAAGHALMTKPGNGPTRWITRERPKVDRIACPWLIKRFIDPDAEFLYVPSAEVKSAAKDQHAVPYDIPDVAFSHDGPRCSFDAFMHTYRFTDPALLQLADIVRGADTGHPEIAPQSAGLMALSRGLSRLIPNDHDQLQQGMIMYDALYLWCKEGRDEQHTWNPQTYR